MLRFGKCHQRDNIYSLKKWPEYRGRHSGVTLASDLFFFSQFLDHYQHYTFFRISEQQKKNIYGPISFSQIKQTWVLTLKQWNTRGKRPPLLKTMGQARETGQGHNCDLTKFETIIDEQTTRASLFVISKRADGMKRTPLNTEFLH